MDASGRPFDVVRFFAHPSVLLRILEMLFGIIVVGVLADQGTVSKGQSIFNGDAATLHYCVGIAATAFLLAIFFLVMQFVEQVSSSLTQLRRCLVVFEAVATALWTLLLLVAFGWAASEWRQMDNKPTGWTAANKNAGNSALAFTFFSVLCWLGSTVYAVGRARSVAHGEYGLDNGTIAGLGHLIIASQGAWLRAHVFGPLARLATDFAGAADPGGEYTAFE